VTGDLPGRRPGTGLTGHTALYAAVYPLLFLSALQVRRIRADIAIKETFDLDGATGHGYRVNAGIDDTFHHLYAGTGIPVSASIRTAMPLNAGRFRFRDP
jgi:hypothetical protein